MASARDFGSAEVAAAFAAMPAPARGALMRLRARILALAEEMGAGPVAEELKWGQPSYRVARGTPLRLGVTRAGVPAVFVHC